MNDVIMALSCLLGREDLDWLSAETDLDWWQVYLWIHQN
ncbi:hypothetical protein ES703_45066 [subsurface metagenome]